MYMHIASRLPQKITCILTLVVACMISAHSLPQSDPAKDKAPLQEKKSDEKKPDIAAQGGGIEILSDTMGVDFGPYMRRLKVRSARSLERVDSRSGSAASEQIRYCDH